LKEKYPAIQGPHKNDICYATTNRQQAVRELAKQSDLVVVVGSKNSSNSNRLAELASRMGVASKLIDDPNDIQPDWFNGVQTIGVTAGASAPEELVQSVIARMKAFGVTEVEELQGLEENMFFEVPKELRVKEVN
jgi:lytB protein